MKTLRSRFYLALSALILMLGFGSCKSSKKAQSNSDKKSSTKVKQGDPSRIRVLYGARPPIKYTQEEEEGTK